MNGVLRKLAEERQRVWDEATRGQVLSVDLVVPEETLFIKSLDELNQLNMAMMDQFVNHGWALKAEGAAMELAFHAQRNLLAELIAFEQSHRDWGLLKTCDAANSKPAGKRLQDAVREHG